MFYIIVFQPHVFFRIQCKDLNIHKTKFGILAIFPKLRNKIIWIYIFSESQINFLSHGAYRIVLHTFHELRTLEPKRYRKLKRSQKNHTIQINSAWVPKCCLGFSFEDLVPSLFQKVAFLCFCVVFLHLHTVIKS